jgi:nucleoside-diphosphate-sugar epimerase
MKVLATGGTGFVGRHVVRELLARGHAVSVMVRSPVEIEGVKVLQADTHSELGRSIAGYGAPDALVHLAWPGLPNYKDLFHLEQNLFADYQFIKAFAGQVLVAGTCFEYGMQSGCLSEDTPTLPSNPYGMAKDMLRRMLELLPLHLQWARLFYLYGEGQNPKSLLSQLDRAIDSGATSFDMSGGEQLRDFLPIEEAAHRLVLLLESGQRGTFNVCSGTPTSVRSLVERHIDKRGARLTLNLGRYPYPDYEPMAFWGDGRKLAAALG